MLLQPSLFPPQEERFDCRLERHPRIRNPAWCLAAGGHRHLVADAVAVSPHAGPRLPPRTHHPRGHVAGCLHPAAAVSGHRHRSDATGRQDAGSGTAPAARRHRRLRDLVVRACGRRWRDGDPAQQSDRGVRQPHRPAHPDPDTRAEPGGDGRGDPARHLGGAAWLRTGTPDRQDAAGLGRHHRAGGRYRGCRCSAT